MRALVVEDDPAIAEPLVAGLQRNGIETVLVSYAILVLDEIASVDVVILDLGLPDGDGLDVLKAVRKISDVPIIIATARGDEADRIIGLELGADDYVVKPFSVRELAARIRAIARRRRNEPGVDTERITIDKAQRRAFVDGNELELTVKEFELLSVLAEEPERVVPRQELFARVWDPVWVGTGKTLDVHVAALRRKLGDASMIETVRGVGYRLHLAAE